MEDTNERNRRNRDRAKLGMPRLPSWYRVPSGLYAALGSDQRRIARCVDDEDWQHFRGKVLKGKVTADKLVALSAWLVTHSSDEKIVIEPECSSASYRYVTYGERAKVQVENYLGALKRGGFITEGNLGDYQVGNGFWEVIKG
jgi:hypothetical protein